MTDRERAMAEAQRLAACPTLADNGEHVGCPFCAGTGLIVDLEPIAAALLEAGARGLTGFGDWLISGLTPDHPDRQVRKDIAAQCDLRAGELRAQKGGGA